MKGFEDTHCTEDIVDKGEIANFEQFHLFPQCFPKAFYAPILKDRGYIVLPLSVHVSVCPSVCPSICLHKLNMKT